MVDSWAPEQPAYGDRRRRLADVLQRSPFDASGILITRQPNVRYLTGFAGSNAVVIVDRGGNAMLGTDARYGQQVSAICEADPDVRLVLDRATLEACAELAIRDGHRVLAVDAAHTRAEADALAIAGLRTVDDRGVLSALRAEKDEHELAAITRACAITAAALQIVSTEVRTGMTEVWVARRIELLFAELGAEDRAFPTIVATGANSAEPHHAPGTTRIEAGDLLIIDTGARVDGYCADMTRTFVVGSDAAGWQRDIAGVTRAAQAAGRDACRAGIDARSVDHAVRAIIGEAGFGEHFAHGTGHGLGLDVHEAPMLGPRSADSIGLSVPLTIEPGIYLPGRGGVRIEDTVVTAEASPRVLTVAPYDLLSIG